MVSKTGYSRRRLTGSQGHSGANHQNKIEDVRNNELFVTINEIKRLKPDILILENVPGMKRDRDGEGNEGAGNFAVEGIKRLRNIGYQVRMVQLDARSFGSPQNRIRLFLICARKGVPLPSIPEPTHANPELKVVNFFSASTSRRPFHVGSKGELGSGPLPPITVRDAISDLPCFEYKYKDHPNPSSRILKFDRFEKPVLAWASSTRYPTIILPAMTFKPGRGMGQRKLRITTPHPGLVGSLTCKTNLLA
jgi:site-specific DNA-cytosine methylase